MVKSCLNILNTDIFLSTKSILVNFSFRIPSEVLGQIGLGKQCRPRSDAIEFGS